MNAPQISPQKAPDYAPEDSPELPPMEVIELPLDPGVEQSDIPALSDQQDRAMIALCSGQSVTAAARAAHVHRGTVHRWLRENADFAAAHNAWQAELRQTARSRLMRLADQAVDVVTNALNTSDAKTAVALLKQFALLSPITPGTTSAAELRSEWEQEKETEDRKRETEKLMIQLGMIRR